MHELSVLILPVVITDPGIKIENGYKSYDDGVALDIFIKASGKQ